MNLFRVIGNLLRFDRANWKAVILCFVTATIFWVFNALNKDYSTNIRFPIRFDYNREEYVPIERLPEVVNINVSGNGWELFRNQLGVKKPELSIAIDHPLEVRKILGASLPPLLQPQIGKLQINYLLTDTLHIQLDEIDSHRFKVAVDFTNSTYAVGYGRISPVVVLPDSITLEGPKSVLHTIPDSLSVVISNKKLDRDFNEEIEVLSANLENITRNPPLVKVIFEVGPIVEIESHLLLKPSMREQGFPDSAFALFRIPAKRQEDFKIRLAEMSATIYSKRLLKDGFAIPHVNKLPPYAELIKIDTVSRAN